MGLVASLGPISAPTSGLDRSHISLPQSPRSESNNSDDEVWARARARFALARRISTGSTARAIAGGTVGICRYGLRVADRSFFVFSGLTPEVCSEAFLSGGLVTYPVGKPSVLPMKGQAFVTYLSVPGIHAYTYTNSSVIHARHILIFTHIVQCTQV